MLKNAVILTRPARATIYTRPPSECVALDSPGRALPQSSPQGDWTLSRTVVGTLKWAGDRERSQRRFQHPARGTGFRESRG